MSTRSFHTTGYDGGRGCLTGLFELFGLFLAIGWPILLLFLWAADKAK